jgi:hypothetical protein
MVWRLEKELKYFSPPFPIIIHRNILNNLINLGHKDGKVNVIIYHYMFLEASVLEQEDALANI